MTGLWEPEEAVGRFWHRLVGGAESYSCFAGAAVPFAAVRGRVGVFYRALGGPGAVRLAAGARGASRHRLSLRQRLGLGAEEHLERASFDGETLSFPARLDCFPDPALNRDLYFWLAAYFVHAEAPRRSDDPLQADVHALRTADAAVRRATAAWPGLATSYRALCRATRAARPRRRLEGWEAGVEEAIVCLLGGQAPASEAGREVLAAVRERTTDVARLHAPRKYRTFLPVPLWGDVRERGRAPAREGDDPAGGASAAADEKRRHARRRNLEQSRRKDALVLHRFEHLPMLSEMLNANRDVDDDDLDAARQAAESLDEITIGGHDRPPATRLKLDLDLAPSEANTAPIAAELTYPEWDYQRNRYHPNHCRVLAQTATEQGADWKPDAAARRRIRKVRRQFEALRPRRQVFPAQADGPSWI